MQADKLSSFISYQLEPNEQRAAYSYSPLQLAGIQNQIAAAAEELLRAPLDEDDNSVAAIKKRAYLQGQISFGKYLMELHDSLNSKSEDNPQ